MTVTKEYRPRAYNLLCKFTLLVFDPHGKGMLIVFWKDNIVERLAPFSETDWQHLLENRSKSQEIYKLRKTKAFPTAKEFFNPVEVHSASRN